MNRSKKLFPILIALAVVAVSVSIGWFSFRPQDHGKQIFKFKSGKFAVLIIPAVINGKAYSFILDTGSDISGIKNTTSGKQPEKEFSTQDSKGRKYRHYSRWIDTVALGSLNILNHTFIDLSPQSPGEGIIGMDILKKFALTIDFPRQEITLTASGSRLDTTKMSSATLEIKNGLPYLPLKINNVTHTFLLDTGYDAFADITMHTNPAVTFDSKFNWHGYDESLNYMGHAGNQTKYVVKTADVSFLKETLRDEIIIYSNRNSHNNLLGLDFFKRFGKVIFDFPNNRLYVGALAEKSLLHYTTSHRFLNDIGIVFNNDSLPKITQIADWINNKALRVGDTIVGLGNSQFIENTKSRKIKLFHPVYEIDQGTQLSTFIKLVRRARFSEDDIRIAVLKNGSVNFIDLKRRKTIKLQDQYLDYVEPTNHLNIPYMTAKPFKSDTASFMIYKPLMM